MYNVCHPQQDRIWTAISWGQLSISDENLKLQPFKNIVKLDPHKHIPKLAMLPGQAPESNIYIHRQVMDDIIHGNMKELQSFSMNLLFTGSKDGVVSINVFGTFNIGEVRISPPSEIVSISSMKNQSRHVLLSRDDNFFYLVPLSVDFINKYGLYLIDVTAVPIKIQATLEYIKDTLALVQAEMKTMSASNQEFLASLSGAIELDQNTNRNNAKFPDYRETQRPSIEQIALRTESALLDSLLSGIANHAIEYWLKELLREKGIKKWRKACFASYDNVRKILFENLLPACERILVLLTEMSGLSKWVDRGVPLGLDTELLQSCIDSVVSMSEMANNLIWSLNSQFQLFRFFSAWIEILYEEVTGIPLKDPIAEASGPKYTVTSRVVEYITKHIGSSMNLPGELDLTQHSSSFSSICSKLDESLNLVFDRIKSKMISNVYPGDAFKLIASDNAEAKIHIVEMPVDTFCYVATCDLSQLTVIFCRFKLNGPAPITTIEVSKVDVTPGLGYNQVQSFQFVNNQSFAILVSTDGEKPKKMLLTLCYSELHYERVSFEQGRSLADLAKDATTVSLDITKSREFTGNFLPKHFTINQLRKVGCLLEEGCRQFIFFDTADDDQEEDEDNLSNE